MKHGSVLMVSFFSFLSLFASSAFADPPPEDVLRPEPDPSGYFFLQPHIGVNYSFLTGERIRPLMPNLNETANTVVESGSGLGLLGGLDIGYAWNEHLATRLGIQLDQRRFGNHGSTINVCNLVDDQGNIVEVREEPVNMEYTVSGTYLTLALMEDFRWNSFYGFLGLSVAAPISSSYTETDRLTDTASPCYYLPLAADSTREITGSLFEDPSFELQQTLKLGVGYIKQLGEATDLVIQVNYDHPLNNLFQGAETVVLENENFEGSRTITGVTDPDARFGTLQATVGIRFNLYDL